MLEKWENDVYVEEDEDEEEDEEETEREARIADFMGALMALELDTHELAKGF